MSVQASTPSVPRSLVKVGESRALAASPVVTRAVGRSVTDSEAFWFTVWDWDTQAIWATARGFFDAYNSGRYDRCLEYISEASVAQDAEAAIDLLRRVRSCSEQVSIEAITDLVIVGSKASGTVDQIICGNVNRQNMSFVKEKGAWKISWPIFWNGNGFLTD